MITASDIRRISYENPADRFEKIHSMLSVNIPYFSKPFNSSLRNIHENVKICEDLARKSDKDYVENMAMDNSRNFAAYNITQIEMEGIFMFLIPNAPSLLLYILDTNSKSGGIIRKRKQAGYKKRSQIRIFYRESLNISYSQ